MSLGATIFTVLRLKASNAKPKQQHYLLGFEQLKSYSKPYYWNWWMHFLNPKIYYHWIKSFCQRGFYGHADCDYWDANSYLETVMLGVITDLKKHAHGYPDCLANYTLSEDHIIPDNNADVGFEKWQVVLGEIIEGLEASNELRNETTIPDSVYSKGPWRFEELEDGYCELIDESNHTFDRTAYELWQAPLLIKRKRAMLLIVKYWINLWD